MTELTMHDPFQLSKSLVPLAFLLQKKIYMRIQNAYQNNLKNISLTIPENQLIVVTGLSGSGKSSLAMGVIGNEGYRYFLESLPAYNQQNSVSIPTAAVDDIAALRRSSR